ncbi:guanosine-3',5'-bis(diphosphate) 3'-pyrophosphohydrolase MESH1-like [Porites lutea]|uniref:guanosine-3',5'-bis(diphosphate) 3'-pyrophosphohydrolase MESH1-like n=1 Tax=Porites lutea TaxID=51062 RepID=UPI003CC57369
MADEEDADGLIQDNPINVIGRILEAVQFAAIKHKDQRRKDPEETPYINHPIGVAYILWKEGGIHDSRVLQGAILHDTVEDTNTTLDEIESKFGPEVRHIVSEVTDDKTLPKMERKRLQIVHAKSCSHKAKLVKLGDKLYNLRDLNRVTPEGWTKERVTEYFHWAHKVVEGLKGTNEALEREIYKLFVQRGVVEKSGSNSP